MVQLCTEENRLDAFHDYFCMDFHFVLYIYLALIISYIRNEHRLFDMKLFN